MKKQLTVLVATSMLVLGLAQPSSALTLPPPAAPQAEAHTHGPDSLELDRRGRGPAAAPYDVDAQVPWNKVEYDSKALTVDAADPTTLPTFHAIYIYPSDKASRFSNYAAMFQADARDASALLGTLYGRGIRFDERLSDSGTPLLDITVVKSKYNSKQLASTRQFDLIAGELANNPDLNKPYKKYFAWLDAGSQYCGQGNLSQDTQRNSANQNENKTLGLVYRPYSASVNDGTTGGFCRGRTLRHELGHNLGALQSVAPHAYDGAHCNDSGEDTMCYTSATSVDTGGPDFDYNNDDYWDPAANPKLGTQVRLPWWTTNLSKFICPTTGCGSPSTPEY